MLKRVTLAIYQTHNKSTGREDKKEAVSGLGRRLFVMMRFFWGGYG